MLFNRREKSNLINRTNCFFSSNLAEDSAFTLRLICANILGIFVSSFHELNEHYVSQQVYIHIFCEKPCWVYLWYLCCSIAEEESGVNPIGLLVTYDGTVLWMRPKILTAACSINVLLVSLKVWWCGKMGTVVYFEYVLKFTRQI